MKEKLEASIKEKGVYVFETALKEAGSTIGEQISTIFPIKHFAEKIVHELNNKALTYSPTAFNQAVTESVS